MTQPVRMQRCEDWTYKCPPVSSPTVMRTSRTAESLDDERTPADNQPPVAPQYHAAPIDLLRQAPCPTCDQAGRVRLAHPVGTGGRCVRRSTQGVQIYGELSLKSSIDERRLARSYWPVGQEEVRATTSLSTADAPTPRQAGPAGRLLSRIIAVGLGCCQLHRRASGS